MFGAIYEGWVGSFTLGDSMRIVFCFVPAVLVGLFFYPIHPLAKQIVATRCMEIAEQFHWTETDEGIAEKIAEAIRKEYDL